MSGYPPLTAATPIVSLDGWDLEMVCAKCGPRTKAVASLYEAVGKTRTFGEVCPRLSCDNCRQKPVKLTGICTWVVKFGRVPPKEDLTFLLQQPVEKAA